MVKAVSRSSQKTRKALLKASKRLFAAHGFSGASISQIAAEAGITPSLIYHYVESKESLWREAKKYILDKHVNFSERLPIGEYASLEDFLVNFISIVLISCRESPKFLRMISWEMLEREGGELLGLKGVGLEEWIFMIKRLQEKKEICPQSHPLLVLSVVLNLIGGPWINKLIDLKDEDRMMNFYISNVVKMLRDILRSFPLTHKRSAEN